MALHSDRTDLSVSQTEAHGGITVYSEACWEGNNLRKSSIWA